MANYIETLLVKHVKLSSIDEGALTKKRAALDDSLALTNSIAKELACQAANFDIADGIGVFLILSSLVSDIVRDSLGVTLSKTNGLLKFGLAEVYDKARDYKWKQSRYEKEIAAIQKNGGYLEKLAKLDKTGMVAMTVTIHKNMLANVVVLKGYTDDSREARMALLNAIKSLQKNIEALERQREATQFYLDTGEGAAKAPPYTPAQAPVALGGLG